MADINQPNLDAWREHSPWKEIGRLPRFDFTKVYANPEAVQLALANLSASAKHIIDKYEHKFLDLTPREYSEFLVESEDHLARFRCLSDFITFYQDKFGNNDGYVSQIQIALQIQSSEMKPLDLKHRRLIEERGMEFIDQPELEAYVPFLREELRTIERYKPTQGAPLADIVQSNREELQRLYQILIGTICDLTFRPEFIPEEAQKLTSIHAPTFASILANLNRTRNHIMQWQEETAPYEASCAANDIKPEAVESLMTTIRDARVPIYQKYWRWCAECAGAEKLTRAEADNTLLTQDKTIYPWTFTREILTQTFINFAPELKSAVALFFDTPLIDAQPWPERNAKGGYAKQRSKYFPGYLFLNYRGDIGSVITGGHEMAHGIHLEASAGQGWFCSKPNIILAESVAIFSEGLLFKALSATCVDENQKDYFRAASIERRVRTLFNEARIHDFEVSVFSAANKGEVSAETLCQLWAEGLRANYGDVVEIDPLRNYEWAHCGSLYHKDYYSYSYCAAVLLAEYWMRDYERRGTAFVKDYLDMQNHGSRISMAELLKPFGVEKLDGAFWSTCFEHLKPEVEWLINDYSCPMLPISKQRLNAMSGWQSITPSQ